MEKPKKQLAKRLITSNKKKVIEPVKSDYLDNMYDTGKNVLKSIRDVNDNKYLQAAKMLDPTGISNYPDVAFAASDLIQDPTKENLANLGGNILGALPMLGKGKTIYNLVKPGRAGNLNKAIRFIEDRVDNVREVMSVAEKPVEMLAKKANTNNRVIKPIAKGAEKIVTTAKSLGDKIKVGDKNIAIKPSDLNRVAIKNISADAVDIAKTSRDINNTSEDFNKIEESTDLRNFDTYTERLKSVPKYPYGGKIPKYALGNRLPIDYAKNAKLIGDFGNDTTVPTEGGTNAAVTGGINAAKSIPGLGGGIAGETLNMAGTGAGIGASFGGPYGAAIGAGIGGAVGLVGGIINSEQAKEEERRARRDLYTNKMQSDAEALENMKYAKKPEIPLYGCGGRMKHGVKKMAVGGRLNTIAPGVEEVDGNTHEENDIDGQYGVTLQDPRTGQPVAEVEDDEVIVDKDKVFSDRLKSSDGTPFSKKMKAIALKTNQLNEKLKQANNVRDRNGIERQLAGMKMQENQLFQEQEMSKMEAPQQAEGNLPMYPDGGILPKNLFNIYGEQEQDNIYGGYNSNKFVTPDTVGKATGLNNWVNTTPRPIDYPRDSRLMQGFEDKPKFTPLPQDVPTAPLIRQDRVADLNAKPIPANTADETFMGQLAPRLVDNFGNAILTALTPQNAQPIYHASPRLETSVNIGRQLAAINRSNTASRDNIFRNTNNSNVARSNVASSNLRHLESKLGVIDTKENREQDLRNQLVGAQTQTANLNRDMMSAYNQANVQRRHDIQSRISGNLGNLSEDIKNQQTRSDNMTVEENKMIIEALKDRTGESMTALMKLPFAQRKNVRDAIEKEIERREANKWRDPDSDDRKKAFRFANLDYKPITLNN